MKRLSSTAVAAGSFYKRRLPSHLISFAGKRGRRVFREALDAGTADCYFALAEQFRTQSEPAFCGLGSLVMSLNALQADPKKTWQGVWRWWDEEMLECCKLDAIREHGITMPEFACLASCNGASATTRYADEASCEDLRADIEKISRSEYGKVMVLSYNRGDLGQTGSGHFSPLGGYLAKEQLVLVLDVARFKYPPHWVSLPELFDSMEAIDESTGRSRGWHILERKERLVYTHFPGHLSSDSWKKIVEEISRAKEENNLLETLLVLATDPTFDGTFPQLQSALVSVQHSSHCKSQWSRFSEILKSLSVF